MPRRKAPSPGKSAPRDPIYAIAEATAREIGTDFLSALVRSMQEAMEVTAALITRGVGEPPVRARASYRWGKRGVDEYDLEGTPCRFVYAGQTLIVPEQLWRRFPLEAGYEGYCGVPLRSAAGRVVGHFAVLSEMPIRNPERTEGIMRIFGTRVEAELQRIEADQERSALIQRLTQAVERLNRQYERTRQANAFKSEVLGMVAHDLRNPLAAITSRAELIGELLARQDDLARGLRGKLQTSCEAIGRSADRMEQMIAGLLNAARNEATAIPLRCAEIDVADAVRVAIGLNRKAARLKRLRITEMPAEAGRIVADEDRIVEAVDNLLSNAVKYSAPGGTILVGTGLEPDRQFAYIRIADRGQGMTADDIGLAFRRFQRLSATPTGGEGSTGLGLAIVKAIAEAHGGSVEAASAGKGQGSTFTFRLPVSGPPRGGKGDEHKGLPSG